jgi:hypothetical protein
MLWTRALLIAVLASLSKSSAPASYVALRPTDTRAQHPQACGHAPEQRGALGLLSRKALLDYLRPAIREDGVPVRSCRWLEESFRRRICHACVAQGHGEQEVSIALTFGASAQEHAPGVSASEGQETHDPKVSTKDIVV